MAKRSQGQLFRFRRDYGPGWEYPGGASKPLRLGFPAPPHSVWAACEGRGSVAPRRRRPALIPPGSDARRRGWASRGDGEMGWWAWRGGEMHAPEGVRMSVGACGSVPVLCG